MGVGIRFDFNQERRCPAFDPCKCVGELVRPGHVNRFTPARASNGAVIDLSEVTSCRVSPKFYGLCVFLEAKNTVVQDDDRNRDAHAHKRFDFGPAVSEAAIPH